MSSPLQPAPHTAQLSIPSNHYHTQRVRSQYPSDASENHVEYILVASFDIDRGSIMEHQYPGPVGGDETMLAELMLPDQAHVRSQDWTIFFLHKDNSAEEEAKEERLARRERRRRRDRIREALEKGDPVPEEELQYADDDIDEMSDDDDDDDPSEDDDDSLEGPPLIYVLNLVNTKQDNTVKRGAVVKAMAICTRHSFLHIYKPLLLLALEEYFRSPHPESLASLYNALNSMDLSLLPRLSLLERFVLQASGAKDMFIEKFEALMRQRMEEDARAGAVGSPDLGPTSSARMKPRYALPRDTHEFESRINYNGIPIPVKIPTAISPETVGDFSLIKLIQTFSGPHSSSPQPFALHPHLTTGGSYTHPIIVLVNALLTQKRIIFLGHNMPSGEVAEAVLAACALASGGMLRGFTRHAFPYTDLTKIDDLLKVPGFIAGVTNPAFAGKTEWWDLLCDLPTGRMKISSKIEAAPITEGLLYFQQQQNQPNNPLSSLNLGALTGSGNSRDGDITGDNAFMDSLLSSIANRHGEAAIRSRWREWVLKFTRLSSAFEECVYGASALYFGTPKDASMYGVHGHGYVWPDEASRLRELAANVHRIEAWRTTRSYFSFIQDITQIWTKRPVQGIDFQHQHDRLRTQRLSPDTSAAIYLALARAVEDAAYGFHTNNTITTPATATATDSSPTTDAALSLTTTLTNTSIPIPDSASASLAPGTPHPLFPPPLKLPATHPHLQYNTILQLLAVLPESNTGLFYLSLGLFHPKHAVREAVVRLLDRVREHAAGRHYWACLGRFAKLAFYRIKREEGGGGK
ncbi:spindle pole body interacting protein [Pseudovirgaria hyperparasitica]|uniref:Spindle pole body interacting protein n=1 Tax=Pseudovirgaria hyperparasitica TaxID=470096 RepID=A0A6A6W0T7_9PEZI|nr:spindle pole body interacting protein [Pseudovirgaria hyperparasitica]KAF2756512.1 spindle pole body interacting protein [Pseudovirgaria hyperparasitica]